MAPRISYENATPARRSLLRNNHRRGGGSTESDSESAPDIEEAKPLLEQPPQRAASKAIKLCFGAAGVYACYLVYGHIQEDVYTFTSDDGQRFKHAWFVQVLECFANILVGLAGRRICGGRPLKNPTGFLASGASQVMAKVLTSLSLAAGLSFPVCVLAKSAKIVPVMLGQLFLGGSKYSLMDYIVAGAVVIGTTMLSLGGNGHDGSSSGPSMSTPLGLALIVASLVADGVTGGLQKRLKQESKEQPPTTYDFLLFTNLSMFLVAGAIALAIGDLSAGWSFLLRHPTLQPMIAWQCLLSAAGQSFIFYLVAEFDPMVCASVTTTRKILSVVWSLSVKDHAVNATGYSGLLLAVGGILLGLEQRRRKDHAVKLEL